MGRFRDFLSDLLFVLGLATVMLSTVEPFLVLTDVSPRDPWGMPRVVRFLQANLFSFRVTTDPEIYPVSDYWSTYWFSGYGLFLTQYFSPFPYVLIAIFGLQIATLILGAASLPLKPRMRIVPLVLCLTIAFLMTWTYFALHMVGFLRSPIYSGSFGNGYRLIYGSIVCISISIVFARGRRTRMMFTNEPLLARACPES